MYASHFRLTDEPFALTPDPAYLYLSPEHREALAAVQYGLLAGRGFCTLVGEVGTGKTTLLYSLLSQVGPEVEAAYIAYTAQSFQDLLGAILRDLHLDAPGRSKGEMLAVLNAHLLKRADEGKTVALVIDEAHDLDDEAFEELRLLSNFETYTRKLVQIVLVGQPELQDRLREPQLRQLRERVGVRAVINPLSNVEMERYIEHRLQCAGGKLADLFDPWAVNHIVRRAAGIPRRANILCHNALLFAYGRGEHQVTARIAREAIAEMDERRPGPGRRPALQRMRLGMPASWQWAAAAAVAAALAAFTLGRGRSTAEHAAPAPPAVAPRVAAVEPPAPPAEEPPHDVRAAEPVEEPSQLAAAVPVPEARAETPAPAPPTPSADPPAVPPAPAAAQATPPAPALAPEIAQRAAPVLGEGDGPFAVTVPQGASLSRIMRSMYGTNMTREEVEVMFAEVRRLNPQVKDINVIMAGDLLRLPSPGRPQGGVDR